MDKLWGFGNEFSRVTPFKKTSNKDYKQMDLKVFEKILKNVLNSKKNFFEGVQHAKKVCQIIYIILMRGTNAFNFSSKFMATTPFFSASSG